MVQTKIFNNMKMNALQNYIINNKLENVFKITERDLVYSQGNVYAFFKGEAIVDVFEIEIYSEIDEHVAYQYILGFLDAYVLFTGDKNFSLQSKVNHLVKNIN